jgi:hypothetical protein
MASPKHISIDLSRTGISNSHFDIFGLDVGVSEWLACG